MANTFNITVAQPSLSQYLILLSFVLLLYSVLNGKKHKAFTTFFVIMLWSNILPLSVRILFGMCPELVAENTQRAILMRTSVIGYYTYACCSCYCLLHILRVRHPSVSLKAAHILTFLCVLIAIAEILMIPYKSPVVFSQVLDWAEWVIIVYVSGVILRYGSLLGKRAKFILLLALLCILGAVQSSGSGYALPLPAQLCMAQVLICIVYQTEVNKKLADLEVQYARIEKDRVDAETKARLSQIRQHFLYNTLITISELCRESPEEASKLTTEFALFLRRNLEELGSSGMIPFTKEMEHVRHYLNVQQVRFPDMQFQYDLQCQDFYLPALTVQPLVENAVRHGLYPLSSGGLLSIASYETDGAYCICVSDNGVGFQNQEEQKEQIHTGLGNVRIRLEFLCKGSLQVRSEKDRGTTVLIEIPKEGNHDSDYCR